VSFRVPNCKSFFVTVVERKHARLRARLQQNLEASCHQDFFSPARQGAESNSRHSGRNIRRTCTIVWRRQKIGDFLNLCCASSRTTQNIDHPVIIDQIYELISKDGRISAKSIAEQLGISRERVGSIIHEDLDMRKLPAKWVPKCLNAERKRQRCQSPEKILEFFQRDSNDFVSGAIGDHGQNLFISLWPRDKATINGVAA